MFWLLHALVFTAAFLLFQIELIAAKALLPAFGGSYLVWGASVMAFQGLLLLGYASAQWLDVARRPSLRWGLCLAFVAAYAIFPLDLGPFSHPDYGKPAALEVAWTLLRTVGPAFFCLAPVSILAQRILADSTLEQRSNPYALYATSNLGSFAGLLSYPFVVEPLFDLKEQLAIWAVAYGAVALALFFAVRGWGTNRPTQSKAPSALADEKAPSLRRKLGWLTLSAAGSLLFLAATNLITFDLAAVPLLWVLPLALYLLSFALAFKQNPWYPDWVRERFPLAAALCVFLFLMAFQSYHLPVLALVGVHLAVLFVVCLVCNGELYRTRPDAARLPGFYLYIALGGFIGGTLASWVVPLLSNAVLEYPLGFFLAALGMCLSGATQRPRVGTLVLAGCVVLVVVAWFASVAAFGLAASSIFAALAGFFLALVFYGLRRRMLEIALCLGLVVLLVPFLAHWQPGRNILHAQRNFYGIYRVYDDADKRKLLHGTTLHGAQFLDPTRQDEALTYYHVGAPAGELLHARLFEFSRIGVVGLGAGSLAVYADPGQEIDFFELDPYNKVVAERYFTFLARCKGKLGLIFGDARLSLGRVENERYSVFIVDAFNSDSIPTHLMTVEAFREYQRVVTHNGLILLHISNKFMDLAPVVRANAQALGLRVLTKRLAGAAVPPDAEACLWAALTTDEAKVRTLAARLGWQDMATQPPPSVRPWTDRYSNLLAVFQ